ncbi:uncharacterized protein LOC104889341 [Beta vulgaris subsp. vulgaris]|uniref:uncharacterized protein LOC104889341 n=1 Tax=Beta vulgaris subsp. vulgaris TaxID=3555 RepID=UPI002036ACEB|nr:uncharacterized protein LOC104889341 [Beta vulgaris subsp. vulgaris]
MAGELIEQCRNLRINDAESKILEISELDDGIDEDQVYLVLVGRLVTERSFNIEAFKRTMIQAWGVNKRMVIRMIGANRFVFQFFHWRDKEKVLEGRPWCFENQLLILNAIDGEDQPADVPLTYSPFWIRLKNLPFNYRSATVCRAIAGKIGQVMELEDDALFLDNYRRVRVMMDVAQPLCRYQEIKGKDGRVFRVDVAYERLPFFCFLCGTIGHGEKECVNVDDDEPE